MTLAAMVLLSAGCAPRMTVYPYPDVIVVHAERSILEAICGAEAGTWDDGRPRAKGESGPSCYEPRPTIWVTDAEHITHEKAHQAGIGDPKRAGYDWNE